MMNEKELIGKIRELRQIKPRKDWVVLTKNQILGQEPRLEIFPFFKPVYAGLFLFIFLIGLFELSQNALPGDFLYPIKRITEKTQAIFVSEEKKPEITLELTQKRLEELAKVAQANKVENLALAINEFQKSASQAAKDLSKIEPTKKDPKEIKKFVERTKEIENKAKEIESLGIVIGEEGLEQLEEARTKLELQAIVQILKDIISDLENNLKMGALTKEKEEMLNKIKELVNEGKYWEAFEFYLLNQK